MIGETVSHYKITAKLGRGGMGVVYEAEDTRLGRTVALKFLPPELTDDPDARRRFVQEARAASALEHANICNIHDIDESADGRLFIVMARYQGETLRDRIKRGPLSVEDALDIALQVSDGLATAHDAAITHRDIKPGNIFITSDGVAKILDFGLARLAGETRHTKTGSTLGTTVYMSPEQARGNEVDPRTDVWSLGVVLYEMLAGRPPFRGDAEPAVVYLILHDTPELLTALRGDLPSGVEDVVEGALQKNPAKRYSNAGELHAALVEQRDLIDMGVVTRRPVRWKRFRRNTRVFYGSLLLAAILLAAVVLTFVFERGQKIDSIAVLPFENLSGDPGKEFYADGMTNGVISDLAMTGSINVISRTSVMRYKGTTKPVRTIADELNVDAVVEATVAWSGNRILVIAHLVDGRRETPIWSQRFERENRDVLNLQSDIARDIAENIDARISPDARSHLARSRTVNPEAYQEYLLGQHWWNLETPGSLDRAIEHFEAAIEIDPEFAPAWAGLAHCYVIQGCHILGRPHDVYPKAREAIDRALELDDRSAEAYAVLAHMTWEYEWDFDAFLDEIGRAIDLNPSFATAYHIYGAGFEVNNGSCDKAAVLLKKALELDPLSVRIGADVAHPLTCAGRYEEARQQIRQTHDLFPNWDPSHDLARVYLVEGDFEQAVTLLESGEDQLYRDIVLARLGFCYAKTNRIKKARGAMETLQQRYEEHYTSAYLIAAIHSALGETDTAFEWLDLAFENRDPFMTRLKSTHLFENIRNDSRYSDLMARVGLE